MQDITEIIEIVVKVKINYPDKTRRKEVIKMAESCAKSCSVRGTIGCTAKSAKYLK